MMRSEASQSLFFLWIGPLLGTPKIPQPSVASRMSLKPCTGFHRADGLGDLLAWATPRHFVACND